jgi:phosphonate transport system permease protein
MGQIAHMVSLMFPPSPGGRLPLYLQALAETLAIALLGTLTAAVLAFPVGFLAAKNVVPNIFAHFAVRRVLDVFRGVDVLIWALIFVNVVGLGPFAGMLAIAAADFGSFGKLFSEAIEAADKRPAEGVVASGGTQLHALRFALIPQVFPVIASQVLYYFESNTRFATIIGIVGAGGIGLYLAEQIRVLEWNVVAFLVLMILIAVAIIDWVSSRLRLAIIGRAAVVL